MQSDQAPLPHEHQPELVPLNAIRVETALSRYPVHRLARKGSIAIGIREESRDGEVLIRWEVDHSRKHGQPGPLAYKLDTLIVNRRIEEAARPIPRIIRLGSLREIADEVGVGNGNTSWVKKALRQNAFAGITAKIRYRRSDGNEQTLEADFTRYSVVFTGERLPDGRIADVVYLVLNDIYMQVINGAATRPLDYDYLRQLPPAAQRFYELLSYRMYAALRHNLPHAKLTYSEYCAYAPQTRYFDWDRVRKQMAKVHAPHKQSGYLSGVEHEQTSDAAECPDWLLLYSPGPKARSEYRAFTRRGGPVVLEMESVSARSAPTPLPEAPAPSALERELIRRGVTARTAAELVRTYPEERIRAQVEQLDWIGAKYPKKIADPGAYLADAIRHDYAAPKGFESPAARARREESEREGRRREAERRRGQAEAQAREQEAQKQIAAYLATLSAEALARLDAAALEGCDEFARAAYVEASSPLVKRLHLRLIREAHVRRVLNLPPAPEALA